MEGKKGKMKVVSIEVGPSIIAFFFCAVKNCSDRLDVKLGSLLAAFA